jgi:hypothetical protein
VKIKQKDLESSVLKGRKSGYHAVLLIGYDKKEKFFIGRDIDSKYMFKGFFKIKASIIEKKFNEIGKYLLYGWTDCQSWRYSCKSGELWKVNRNTLSF